MQKKRSASQMHNEFAFKHATPVVTHKLYTGYISLKTLTLILLLLLAFFSSCKKDDNYNSRSRPSTPKTRVYYIAAEEVEWNYVPQGKNVFTGKPFNHMDSMFAVRLFTPDTQRIGPKYIKAKYIEYTDASFKTPKPVSPEWEQLGILGPVIRGVVGDSIIVHFVNRTSIKASIHVHGLFYDKASEGSGNASSDPAGVVAPGGSHTYQYFVREDAGPGPAQGSSALWLYHSGVNTNQSDLYAGMVGAIIVTKKGMADENAKPRDVDRELVTLYMIFNENQSELLPKSINTYLPGFTNPAPLDFDTSNRKHSINGLIMGNLPGLTMNKGQRVRWYVFGLGGQPDQHTAHWHGNVAIMSQRTTDVIELLPASAMVADMRPDDPGTWAYHCHVSDHAAAGMDAFYTVNP